VRLDAEAITNGTVVVEVSVSSPATGVAIGTPRRFNADLQAQWETVGIIVGAIAAVVFAVGIARNVIVRRKAAAREQDREAQEAA
jgi:ethanolamine transporter EutH